MKKELPNLMITIDDEYSNGEDLGVSAVAFTKRPAILIKGMAFNSQIKPQFFSDDLKYRICAPAMIPMEIYRNDEDGEYMVTFTESEIEKIHSKFMSNYKSTDIFNLEHNVDEIVPAYILETWIVDKPLEDKAYSTFGIEVPKGTLMMTAQITDKDYYYELVKNGQVGYSIEGFLGMKLSEINNNETQKLEKMNETNLMLPAGEYTDKDGKVFIVAEDGTISIKEEMACEPKQEEMALEVDETAQVQPEATSGETITKEEEMAEVVTEDVTTETATPVQETYSKEEVDAKFEELYKIIAEMQSEEDMEVEEEPMEMKKTEMNIHDRFSAFVAFAKQSN